jgi:hypothetical protein
VTMTTGRETARLGPAPESKRREPMKSSTAIARLEFTTANRSQMHRSHDYDSYRPRDSPGSDSSPDKRDFEARRRDAGPHQRTLRAAQKASSEPSGIGLAMK